MISKIDPADVRGGDWEVFEITPVYRRSRLWLEPDKYIQKTEFFADEELQTLNTEERNSRDSKPWSTGLGSDKGGNVPMVRVARIPLNKLYSEITGKMREGDKDHLKWWLNRDENQPFRTKSGKL